MRPVILLIYLKLINPHFITTKRQNCPNSITMKKNIDNRTIYVGFIRPVTDAEIMEEAKSMKDGKAYLFRGNDGLMIIKNKRRLNSFEEKRMVFVRKLKINS